MSLSRNATGREFQRQVCMCVRARKGKRLELSTSKLGIDIRSRRALILSLKSKDQRSMSRQCGYACQYDCMGFSL